MGVRNFGVQTGLGPGELKRRNGGIRGALMVMNRLCAFPRIELQIPGKDWGRPPGLAVPAPGPVFGLWERFCQQTSSCDCPEARAFARSRSIARNSTVISGSLAPVRRRARIHLLGGTGSKKFGTWLHFPDRRRRNCSAGTGNPKKQLNWINGIQ